mmetsp:Transcript_26018/g.60742  ORF Transcript_26018/g.60742 Transcript_26018/m.60742 type:complete len:230 (+) Transcript_26018:932-1621(+)
MREQPSLALLRDEGDALQQRGCLTSAEQQCGDERLLGLWRCTQQPHVLERARRLLLDPLGKGALEHRLEQKPRRLGGARIEQRPIGIPSRAACKHALVLEREAKVEGLHRPHASAVEVGNRSLELLQVQQDGEVYERHLGKESLAILVRELLLQRRERVALALARRHLRCDEHSADHRELEPQPVLDRERAGGQQLLELFTWLGSRKHRVEQLERLVADVLLPVLIARI